MKYPDSVDLTSLIIPPAARECIHRRPLSVPSWGLLSRRTSTFMLALLAVHDNRGPNPSCIIYAASESGAREWRTFNRPTPKPGSHRDPALLYSRGEYVTNRHFFLFSSLAAAGELVPDRIGEVGGGRYPLPPV
jgi:hypothetical protein